MPLVGFVISCSNSLLLKCIVCVCERDRQRQRRRETESQRQREKMRIRRDNKHAKNVKPGTLLSEELFYSFSMSKVSLAYIYVPQTSLWRCHSNLFTRFCV